MCPSRSIKLSVRKGVTTRHEYKLFKLHGKRCIRTGGSFLFPSTWLKDSPLQPTCLQFLWKRAQIALEMFDYAFRKQQLPTLGLRIHGSLGISSTMSPGMWFVISSWQILHFNSFKLFFLQIFTHVWYLCRQRNGFKPQWQAEHAIKIWFGAHYIAGPTFQCSINY